MSQISASPLPFRELLPKVDLGNTALRQVYVDALVWLLQQDLIVQVHTRARVLARPDIKEVAWRKQWEHRRERWLRRLAQRIRTDSSSTTTTPNDDMETPRGTRGDINPMEASVPGPRLGHSMIDQDFSLAIETDSENSDVDQNAVGEDAPEFSVDQVEPKETPNFEASFIFKPSRAQKEEARWLRVIRESADEVWASKFDL